MDSVAKEVTRWNPYTDGYFQDPYPHLHACRETNPVQQGYNGEWVLFRHRDVKEALRSPDFQTGDLSGFFRKKESAIFKNTTQCPYLARTTSHWLPYLNGDEHERARLLIERVLGRFDLKEIIRDCIDQAFDQHIAKDRFDATMFGAALPVLMFNRLYGGPWNNKEGIAHLKKVSHSLATSQDIFVPIKTYQAINEDMQWFFETTAKDFELNNGRHDLLSHLDEVNQTERLGFSRDEMVSMIGILLLGSIETSQIAISTIIYELLRNRQLIDFIVNADEIMINVLSEEFFRYVAPQQYTIRVNQNELLLGGKIIAPGSRLFLCLAAANRDPDIFPDPDNIVTSRKNNPHLSFGSGAHACVGSRFARMEMRALLGPLAARLEEYELEPESSPRFHKSIFIRGFEDIMVVRK